METTELIMCGCFSLQFTSDIEMFSTKNLYTPFLRHELLNSQSILYFSILSNEQYLMKGADIRLTLLSL